MNEFALINTFFQSIPQHRDDVIIGIGDDAACLRVPPGMELLVSCDTLVADVHFLSKWDAYDIAYRSVMVNVSDLAAMAASPCWALLALTLPAFDKPWLQRFSAGLRDALAQFNVALVGGDTTRGPLCITLTIHGLATAGKAIRRSGATPGDIIYLSGELGGAAQAVALLHSQAIDEADKHCLMQKLLHPVPRIDLTSALQTYATAAIDISDGLSADLNHICEASQVGACLHVDNIPVHPLVKKYQGAKALDFAVSGGDDYELCFTVSPENEGKLLLHLANAGLSCFSIGVIEAKLGLRAKTLNGECVALTPRGYSHF